MAKWAPGVVKVQKNSGTGQLYVNLPKNVQEDIDPAAQELILFYKRPVDDDWSLRKISHGEKEQIQNARKKGRILRALQSILS